MAVEEKQAALKEAKEPPTLNFVMCTKFHQKPITLQIIFSHRISFPGLSYYAAAPALGLNMTDSNLCVLQIHGGAGI